MFCDRCDISMDLHYGDDDCDGAELRARVVESWPRVDTSPATEEPR